MATLDLDNNEAKYQVRSYKPGRIQINDSIHNHSVIVSPHTLIENWSPSSVKELSAQALMKVTPLKPDILLIGTGSEMVLLSPSLYGELINLGIGVEVMDTSAACRTYNALSAENRNVAAALLIR